WTSELRQTPIVELPSFRARPAAQTFDGAVHTLEVAPDLADALRTLSRHEGATLFMTLLSAFVALVHRSTGLADVPIGTGIANRRWGEAEQLLGMLVTNVVIRTRFEGDPTFAELIRLVKARTLDAYANQDVPFDHVVKAVNPPRDASRNPLFQLMFSFHDSPL